MLPHECPPKPDTRAEFCAFLCGPLNFLPWAAVGRQKATRKDECLAATPSTLVLWMGGAGTVTALLRAVAACARLRRVRVCVPCGPAGCILCGGCVTWLDSCKQAAWRATPRAWCMPTWRDAPRARAVGPCARAVRGVCARGVGVHACMPRVLVPRQGCVCPRALFWKDRKVYFAH